MTTATDLDRLDVIEAKLDRLTDQMALVTRVLEAQDMRRRAWDDLRSDLAPIADQAFDLASRELDEIRDFVAPADLLRVAKRLLRDLPQLEAMLDQLQSFAGLASDIMPLTGDAAVTVMARLDDLERRGYFTFARGMYAVADRIVTSYDEDDLAQLGDNIVLILNTVKEMTQPEVMQLLQRTAHEVRAADTEEIGLVQLMWRMRNPAVRRGLSRMLKVLESFADTGPNPIGGESQEHATDDQRRS